MTDVFSLAGIFLEKEKGSQETYDSIPFYLLIISGFTHACSLYETKQRRENFRSENLSIPENKNIRGVSFVLGSHYVKKMGWLQFYVNRCKQLVRMGDYPSFTLW